MKKITLTFLIICFSMGLFSQIHYSENSVADSSSAIGVLNTSIGINSFASGKNCIASGNQSTALGLHAIATGTTSCSFGAYNNADATMAVALGSRLNINGTGGIAIGNKLQVDAVFSHVIGLGLPYNYLQNNINYSLMIGYYSNIPTFFVGPSSGAETTGKIGIGNITSPEAKLHIKADNNENADIFLNPYNNSDFAIIKFANHEKRIEAKMNSDLSFYTDHDFYFANGEVGIGTSAPNALLHVNGDFMVEEVANFNNSVGIGVNDPVAKLQVNGDIFIDNSNYGLILKSPDGLCWRGNIDNSGELSFESIDCELLSTMNENNTSDFNIKVFPNPTQNMINITTNNNINLYASFYDLKGALISRKKIENENFFYSIESFKNGYYILKIINDKNKILHSEKILKE